MGREISPMLDDVSSNMSKSLGSLTAEIDQIPTKQPSDPAAKPPGVGDDCDDDVQFMYCAPKSKRKKRKR